MSAPAISRETVARMWLRRGIEDLYFSFQTEWNQLQDYAMFVQIMGLEKHLKAVLLYHSHAEYEILDEQAALIKLDKLARRWSHNFLDMMSEIDKPQWVVLKPTLERQHHAWSGEQLVKALETGYQETRYPVVRPSWRSFPSKQYVDTYHDPLGSSDADGLIREVCTLCLDHLATLVDIGIVMRGVRNRHRDNESFARFKNTFFTNHWPV